MPPSPILELASVSKIYPLPGGREHPALRDASATVEPGATVAVIGRSGSGKSTLLHLASGIDVPTSGSVRLLGKELGALPEAERTRLRRDGVGLVFQFFHLLPHLSVRDNVLLPCWIAGDRDARGRADELLSKVGLLDRAGDPAGGLSGGEMQRVALCRALVRKPRLLLADEPTGNLDDGTSGAVMELLLGLVRDEGGTLVYVTHSLELASLADRTWRLTSGVLETA